MIINKNTDILGVVATEDMVEGRMVLLTVYSAYPGDLTGRLTDLPGVKLPDTPAEAATAHFTITWQVDNREPPLISWPSYAFSMRKGFDQAANTPFTTTTYLTYPGYQESMTIPSGDKALAFGQGTYTVPSGQFVYNAAMRIPGTPLRACDTATDGAVLAGMLAVLISGYTAVAVVERFNPVRWSLTYRTFAMLP